MIIKLGMSLFLAGALAVGALGGYVSLRSLDWWAPEDAPREGALLFVQAGDVYLLSLSDGVETRLTHEGRVIWARFTPDGKSFFYIAPHEGYYAVKRADISGEGAPEVVASEEGTDFICLDPFPDGKHLALVARRMGRVDLWIYDLEAGTFTRLTDTPAQETTVDVAPNNKMLTFVSVWEGSREIFLATWDLDDPGELSPKDIELSQLTQDAFFDEVPRISPDGRWIAFESNRSGTSEIWVMSVFGHDLFPFTLDRWRNSFPAWSPDMSELAYGTRKDGEDSWTIQIEETY